MSAFNFGTNGTDYNYSGELLEDLLTYTAQENETYKEGLIHVKSGIQMKYTLPMIQLGKIIQDHVATPSSDQSGNDTGKYNFSERYLEPQDFMVYFEFNPRDFEKYYKPFQPNGNLVFRELDPKIQATMVRLLMENKAEYIDSAIWNSAKGGATVAAAKITKPTGGVDLGTDHAYGPQKYFDGAIFRLLDNAFGTDGSRDERKVTVVGNTAFADATDSPAGQQVEAALRSIWKATPVRLRKKANMVFLMDQESWDAYDTYLNDKTVKYVDNTAINKLSFKGKKIIPMSSLPANTIVFGVFTTGMDSNLWMGVDYANDENVLQIEKLQANSELYFFKMILKMDVNIVRPGEIFVWSTYTKKG